MLVCVRALLCLHARACVRACICACVCVCACVFERARARVCFSVTSVGQYGHVRVYIERWVTAGVSFLPSPLV